MTTPAIGTFRFASAISDEDHTEEALEEAVGEAMDQMGEGLVDLAIVFASAHHRNAFGRVGGWLRHKLRAQLTLGVTAGAVLGSGVEIEERAGLAVLVGRMPRTWLYPFTHDQLDWPATKDDPHLLRERLTGHPDHRDDLAGIVFFADPYTTPMVKLMPAINEALPGVPIIGGMASGAAHSGDNRLLLNGDLHHDGAVGFAIGGDVRVDCTVSQGCRPIGDTWVITKARNNIIEEVGGKPVLQIVHETTERLETADRALLEQGLFVGRVVNEYKDRFGRGDFLVRNILGADRQRGYIAVNDLVRVGQTIQFHLRDRHTAMEDLQMLLEGQKLHGPAAGALLCTCNGRGTNLFGDPNIESNIIRTALDNVPLAGFFAAGEIGPIGHQNFLHGFTSSLAVFRPKENGEGAV
ncbi:MAG: hypothetical protein GC159_06585 [Phycisphaera sp.]|nr:hypothetical protein [Phycisphaera sp.]